MIVSPHPRSSSQHGTIPFASETPPFPVIPFLSDSSALFSEMAPTHLHSFHALTHSFHRHGGWGALLTSRAPSGSECTPSQRKAALVSRHASPSSRRTPCLSVGLSRSFPASSHQIPAPPLFSFTYKLPIFYLLCFDIHPCNGGGCTPLPVFQGCPRRTKTPTVVSQLFPFWGDLPPPRSLRRIFTVL